jgi:hypothetical protein
MFSNSIRDNKELKHIRQQTYDSYRSKTKSLARMAPFVSYRFIRALECYHFSLYEESILFAGLALEEYLANLYEYQTNIDPSKKYLINNKPVKTQNMDLNKFLDWASQNLIIQNGAKKDNIMNLICFIRNYYPHSHRANKIRFKEEFHDNKINTIKVKKFSNIHWFQKLYELSLGAEFDKNDPIFRWLFSPDTTANVLSIVFNIIDKTTPWEEAEIRSRYANH